MDDSNNEEQVTIKKTRGRPKGTIVGSRPVIWVVAGIIDEKLIQSAFQADGSSSNDELENFSVEQAKEAFIAKYGKTDQILVIGPHYKKMGKYIAQNQEKNKETFSVTGKENLNGLMRNAIFHEWKGVASAIDDRTDGYLFTPIQRIDSNSNSDSLKKNPPKRTGVYTEFLEFID